MHIPSQRTRNDMDAAAELRTAGATWDTIGADGFYAPPGDYFIGYGIDSPQTSSVTSGDALRLTD